MKEALAALTQRFHRRCGDDLQALDEALAAGDLERVRFVVHKLAGAAGAFDEAALSQAALELDEQMADGAAPDGGLVERLRAELARVAA